MSSSLPARIPRKTLSALRDLVIPEETSPHTPLQLVVTTDDSYVNVREFAAYLAFTDEVYGRLMHGRLDSYVRRREEQLELTSVSKNSLELIFTELLSNHERITALIVIYFLLKYLPTVPDLASAYHEYQQGREVRDRRKQLREQIRREEQTSALDRRRQNDLVQLLDDLYGRERKLLLRARRFSIEHVHKVTLRLKRDNEDQEID